MEGQVLICYFILSLVSRRVPKPQRVLDHTGERRHEQMHVKCVCLQLVEKEPLSFALGTPFPRATGVQTENPWGHELFWGFGRKVRAR